jgi:hypothetical protein
MGSIVHCLPYSPSVNSKQPQPVSDAYLPRVAARGNGCFDYAGLFKEHAFTSFEAHAAFLMEELPLRWVAAYKQATFRLTDIYLIRREPFRYYYDDYATLEQLGKAPYDPIAEARIVAAPGYSTPLTAARDDYRLKGWAGPTEQSFGRAWDKGHFMAHSIGGAVDGWELNVFVQYRRLNRGWSKAGQRFRQMEAYCVGHPGVLCFNRPIYRDGSAKPVAFEFGVLKRSGELWVECFRNR